MLDSNIYGTLSLMTSIDNTAKKVFLETFGCQMNVLDSQLMHSQLAALGYQFTDQWKKADVILYNTCSVRERAEQKVYSRIGRVANHKKEHPNVVLGVVGCMAEREGESIAKRYKSIDLLCGPGELDKLPMLIDNVVKTAHVQSALAGNTHRRSSTFAAAEDQLEMLDLSRSFSPDEHQGSAYVRVTRGCNKFCTYCVVPNTRGAEVHRPPNHLVEECRKLVDAGVVEITLLGQTVNHYHYDQTASVMIDGIAQPQVGSVIREGAGGEAAGGTSGGTSGGGMTRFSDLLYRIHEEVPGLQRLRFVTSFPRDFGDDILEVMRDCSRICRYLHLPVQSGSDRILKMMNRDYTVASFYELLDRVRHYLPDCQIASDLICGFPTETEEDQQMTVGLLRKAQFKNCFIFKYSPRPGTVAIDRMPDDVSEDLKKKRNNALLDVQNEVSAQVHQAIIGQTANVFVEGISHKALKQMGNEADPSVTLGWEKPQTVTQLTGRTGGDLIVLFDADPSLIGSIVPVRIESASSLMLLGRLTAKPAVIGS